MGWVSIVRPKFSSELHPSATFYMKTFSLPSKGEYHPYYETYISQLEGQHYAELIRTQLDEWKQFIASKPAGWDMKAYALGKWTPKEVLGHLLDTERIMTFRALCIARGEQQSLPGYDQDAYVPSGSFNEVPLADLMDDFEAQRLALLSLVKTLPDRSFAAQGTANGNSTTVRALLWIIPGHFMHHFNVIKQAY